MRFPFRAFTLCVCVCVQLVPGLAEEAEAGVDSEPVEAHREAVPSTHTAARDDEVADIILAAIGDAHSQDALIALFGGLTKALTARTPGVCGVCVRNVSYIASRRPDVMAAAVGKRETDTGAWTGDVARAFGAFLKALADAAYTK